MSKLKTEPPVISSLEQLAATAASVADGAVSRYEAQARRMRQAGADALAATYDALVRQQREQAVHALARLSGTAAPAPGSSGIEGLLDDEETDSVAPELLDPYRIFAVAVRNGERIFAFWSYVAAHAPSADVRRAAEELARDELARVAALRQRRRASFHALRGRVDRRSAGTETLENRLAALLEERRLAVRHGAEQRELASLAGQARERASQLARTPLDPALKHPPSVQDAAWNSPGPLCEALLDRYLAFAEKGREAAERDRAQAFAAELIACLRFLRGVDEAR